MPFKWLTVEESVDEFGNPDITYSDSYAFNEVGGGITIWFEDSAGNIKCRNLFYSLSEDDRELKEFIEKMVEFLDVIFVNQNEVSIILPALNEEVRRVRPEEFMKIGELRVNIKSIQAYWKEDIDVTQALDINRLTSMVIPDEMMIVDDGFLRVIDLLDIANKDGVAPMLFVELDKPREIFGDRSPTIIPMIYTIGEGENPEEERDRQFNRLDSVLLKSRITMPEHFEGEESGEQKKEAKSTPEIKVKEGGDDEKRAE